MPITIDLMMFTGHPGSFTTNLFAINAGRSITVITGSAASYSLTFLYIVYSHGGNVWKFYI